MPISDSARKFGVSACIDCGKCSWGCPVSHKTGEFSPRRVVENFLGTGNIPMDKGLWDCMTCGMCSQLCTSGVSFHEFIRETRPSIRRSIPPETTHSDILHIIQNLTSLDHIKPRTNNWMTSDLELDERSSTLLFVGCTPYYDVIFRHLRKDLLEIPRSSTRLLNSLGIRPRVLEQERCCGHDAYWLGDEERFRKLAEANVDAIERTGVDRVVVFCPECYVTLRQLYPKLLGPLGFQVENLTVLLADALRKGEIDFAASAGTLTYHDPCRLARHAGITEEPRALLKKFSTLVEMPRFGTMSPCCGTSCWINCDASTKVWQSERLREAKMTTADSLVTSCPKCLLHFSCAMHDSASGSPEWSIPIDDIHVLAARNLFKR
ncbi:MAG: (Fe-S)-binding protein [Methanomassiliicoccales archaeon]|nr:(Fe-S)-binding protein [Methanomassiliicoccales archaeon]